MCGFNQIAEKIIEAENPEIVSRLAEKEKTLEQLLILAKELTELKKISEKRSKFIEFVDAAELKNKEKYLVRMNNIRKLQDLDTIAWNIILSKKGYIENLKDNELKSFKDINV